MEWSYHPLNLALRFGLEITALYVFATETFARFETPINWISAVIVVVIAGAIWGVFKVPGDRTNNGNAIVPISGVLRFLLEFTFFFIAIFLLILAQRYWFTGIFGFLIFFHYLTSLDRFVWLLKN
jgi:hypothetical protein